MYHLSRYSSLETIYYINSQLNLLFFLVDYQAFITASWFLLYSLFFVMSFPSLMIISFMLKITANSHTRLYVFCHEQMVCIKNYNQHKQQCLLNKVQENKHSKKYSSNYILQQDVMS